MQTVARFSCGCCIDGDAPPVMVWCPLHAAAPDLLAALEHIHPPHFPDGWRSNECRPCVAIRKARRELA